MTKELDQNLIEKANKLTDCLLLDMKSLAKVMDILESEFQLGLKDEESATIKMLITYVRNLPTNKEKGRYLALDLGGTNLRVILIDLDSKDVKMDAQVFQIPPELMRSDGELLFGFIADSIVEFISSRKLDKIRIALAFTFSFPCTQYGLSQAKLNVWTKGFSCPNVVGRDVVKLLKTALHKKLTKKSFKALVDIVALINDTTGTLMSCAHTNPDCNIGLTVGTGCNACYIENLENIEKWGANYYDPKQVIINTEFGAFGDNDVIDFIRTVWDQQLDMDSINVGRQKYEKMVSGMYLGEVIRLVLLTLINEKLLFKGKTPLKLTEKYSFPTKYVSKVDTDTIDSGFPETRQVLDRYFTTEYTETDLHVIYIATNRVSKRAADLVAAGVTQLIKHMGRTKNTIAYDGSVIRFHPHFKEWVNHRIRQLVNETIENGSNVSFELMLSEDGSGRGAAIVAAVQYSKKRPKIVTEGQKVYELGV